MAVQEPPSIPPHTNGLEDPNIIDPPPPYPTRERRPRTARTHRGTNARVYTPTTASLHTHSGSGDSYLDADTVTLLTEDDARPPTETTPFLGPRQHWGRPRAQSYTSTLSAAPSLTQTVISIFLDEDGDESDIIPGDEPDLVLSTRRGIGFFAAWRQYFRPLGIRAYYRALFHLLLINFPYGLLAWVYLFVFTVTGTILLVALPLGALLCFFDLLGARGFSRGELALQARFHGPLTYAPRYPPHPIFRRYRPATTSEIESGRVRITRNGLLLERSFYKNTYAMFTDPTSYQALFYFLVVKPAITLLISIGIVVFALPAIILVLPAPAALRIVRRVGKWQANVAVEGLYVPVR